MKSVDIWLEGLMWLLKYTDMEMLWTLKLTTFILHLMDDKMPQKDPVAKFLNFKPIP